jgi:hypothetical protein
MAIKHSNKTSLDKKNLRVALRRQTFQAHSKGRQGGGGRGGSGSRRSHSRGRLGKTKRLAAEFKALGGGALAMAPAQEAELGDPLRECWLARERLRVSEARSINRAFILTAHTDAAAETAEVVAAEAAAAEAAAVEAAAAMETAAAAEAAAAAGSAAKSRRRYAWRASGLGARAAERAWWRRKRHGRGRLGAPRRAEPRCLPPSSR